MAGERKEVVRGGNWKQVERGNHNRAAIRAFLATHLGATQREVSAALGISIMAVNRHVNALRAEWRPLGDGHD